MESLEIEYVKFIQNLDCINDFIDAMRDCVKNVDSKKSNVINLGNSFIYDDYNKYLIKDDNAISLTKIMFTL